MVLFAAFWGENKIDPQDYGVTGRNPPRREKGSINATRRSHEILDIFQNQDGM